MGNKTKQSPKSALSSLGESVQSVLREVHVTFNPYYVYLEGLADEPELKFQEGFADYSIEHLTAGDMKTIAGIPGRRVGLAELLKRVDNGQVCLGIKHLDELVSFTWYDVNQSNIKGRIVPLKQNEAYLFDAYTLDAYRGKGLAPYMRYRVYRELAELGKTRLYSFTDYFNSPAIRFKQKLNAKLLQLRVIVGFRRWRFNVLLKRYMVNI